MSVSMDTRTGKTTATNILLHFESAVPRGAINELLTYLKKALYDGRGMSAGETGSQDVDAYLRA